MCLTKTQPRFDSKAFEINVLCRVTLLGRSWKSFWPVRVGKAYTILYLYLTYPDSSVSGEPCARKGFSGTQTAQRLLELG